MNTLYTAVGITNLQDCYLRRFKLLGGYRDCGYVDSIGVNPLLKSEYGLIDSPDRRANGEVAELVDAKGSAR